MISSAEHAALISNRENMYRLLGRFYRVEVDQTFLNQMKSMEFPAECVEKELVEGYRMLEHYLRGAGSDPLTDLAVDYAKAFLGAGIAKGDVAYPYESVYTSPERLVMQDARDQVVAIYRSKGLNGAQGLDVPEDHVALELEFMVHLCHEAQDAIAASDWPAVSASLKEQESFLRQHLLNWIPDFCTDVQKCAETEFYQAAAKITNGYLRMEQVLVEGLIAETLVAAV